MVYFVIPLRRHLSRAAVMWADSDSVQMFLSYISALNSNPLSVQEPPTLITENPLVVYLQGNRASASPVKLISVAVDFGRAAYVGQLC